MDGDGTVNPFANYILSKISEASVALGQVQVLVIADTSPNVVYSTWFEKLWDVKDKGAKIKGVLSFHDLEEIWLLTLFWGLYRGKEKFKEKCSRDFNKSFELEKERYQDWRIPKLVFFESTQDLEARMWA